MKKFFLFSFLLIFCFFLFHPVALAKTLEFSPNVSLGSFKVGQSVAVPGDFSLLKKYIIAVYKFIIGLSAILAVIVIAIGGFLWITAAGSAGQVSKAKGLITGSLFGLVLTLLSYSLLQAVNPDITNLDFQGAKIKDIDNKPVPGCNWQQDECFTFQNDYTDSGDMFCGAKSSKDDKYCCCGADTLEGAEREKCANLGKQWLLMGGVTAEGYQYMCQSFCLNFHYGKALDYQLEHLSGGVNFLCCKCSSIPIYTKKISYVACDSNADCKRMNQPGKIEYTCWVKSKFGSVCLKCLPKGIKCEDNYQCCSGTCSLTSSGEKKCQ